MPKLNPCLLAALVCASMTLPASAQWVWRDKNNQNRITASQTPPPASVDDKDILQRPSGSRKAVASPASEASAAAPSAPAASAPLAPKTVEPELEAKRRKAEQDEAAKKKAEEQKVAAAKAENCARARDYMRTLDSGVRVARTGPTGEREILDDKQRSEEAKRTRSVIASDCK